MAETATWIQSYVNRDALLMWSAEDLWRAPLGDFPPPWACTWGDDAYGLWADLAVNGVIQRMRWIEPSGPEGFWMGSTKWERAGITHNGVRHWANKTEHEPKRVVIEHGFWLADTPCTQAFWLAVTGKNPSHLSKGPEAAERPVDNVSWSDVMDQFVARFAQTSDWGAGERLCLPSEQQWEYAARAGTRSAYWWGDDWQEKRGNADVSRKRGWGDKDGTTPVRRHAPNPWGLHDIHGNVWEWCSDLWQSDEDAFVVRGGSWLGYPAHARAAYRIGRQRVREGRDQGFRFALRYPVGLDAQWSRTGWMARSSLSQL